LLSESKGVLVLLDALRLLEDRGVSAHLEFVGGFESDAFSREVQARVASCDLASKVAFRGILVGDAKADAYAAADALCVPTFFESESFGLVAVEAMTFGLPVVATRWRGLVDVVVDQETGVLVSPRNPEQLADALEWLIVNPTEARAMGRRGRARYEELFTLDRHLRAMRVALDSVLDDRGELAL
jgi:glycosyltransferase involved in cell wall biosynthesis